MDRQAKLDAKAIREKKAVGADDEGGQDYIHPGQRVKPKMKFRGVRIRDDGPDSWGVGQGLK